MKPDPHPVIAGLVWRRKELHLTHSQLAYRLTLALGYPVRPSEVLRWEDGLFRPSFDTVVAWARALDRLDLRLVRTAVPVAAESAAGKAPAVEAGLT